VGKPHIFALERRKVRYFDYMASTSVTTLGDQPKTSCK